jgi:hypothetical protein
LVAFFVQSWLRAGEGRISVTIQIGVKNLDSRDGAIVVVKAQTADGKPVEGSMDTDLRGGEETEKWVHVGQRLVVEEVRNG